MPSSVDPDLLLLAAVRYEGPWERLALRLGGVDPGTCEIRRDVPDGSLRDRLADWCGRRDDAWRGKWARDGREPPPRWKRKC